MSYINAERAARHLDFVDDQGRVNMNAFYCWIRRHGITKYHRGRVLLFKQEDLDAAVEGRDVLVERALRLHSGGKR